jgi:hypothetical protein
MSGFHIKPKGVKKPFNPILGEFYRCRYKFDDAQAFYLCEQVSHHPPISAYFYACPKYQIVISGEIRPKAKFLGNSAATFMEGSVADVALGTSHYYLTPPNTFARGLLFGTMFMELGDYATVKSIQDSISSEIEFKTKAFFGSSEGDLIQGKIKVGEDVAYKLGGSWSGKIDITDQETHFSTVLFDAKTECCQKIVTPVCEQEEYESGRLWENVANAIIKNDQDKATVEKTRIEENQRFNAKNRETNSIQWKSRFFHLKNDKWHLRILEEYISANQEYPKNLRRLYLLWKNLYFQNPPMKCMVNSGVNEISMLHFFHRCLLFLVHFCLPWDLENFYRRF